MKRLLASMAVSFVLLAIASMMGWTIPVIVLGGIVLVLAVWLLIADHMAWQAFYDRDEPPWLNNGEEGRRGWGCDE